MSPLAKAWGNSLWRNSSSSAAVILALFMERMPCLLSHVTGLYLRVRGVKNQK
jgi:hypothetical protein